MDEQKGFPKFDYHLDESDPDVVVLRRQDGSFAAAFSARGATREGIVEAAKEDYAKLVEAYASSSPALREEDARERIA
jgi:hypothetical protein